ncbi:MAG: hypothetical protein LBC18_08690 [Opitutaceae bacterium]|jgi:hypothetical protein|nr:hypothetical protein [Opitutaceae bacterium]
MLCALRAAAQAPGLDVFPHDDAPGQIAIFKPGARLFTNRDYKLAKPPAALDGMRFLRVPIEGMEIFCATPGEIFVLTPVKMPGAASQATRLLALGFTEDTHTGAFQLYGSDKKNSVSLYRKTLKPGERLKLGKWCIVLGPGKATFNRADVPGTRPPELLYNGIMLPEIWPPRDMPKDRSVKAVPYLKNIPGKLPIDVGRQLFVDDFLIESTTLERRFHYPKKYEGNPVLKPETELELDGGDRPCATLFNDGVVFDPKDKLFKIWYHAGMDNGTGYAVSRDGIQWTRPCLDIDPGTNRVLAKHEGRRDGTSVFLDHDETSPARRFKMFLFERPEEKFGGQILTSPDGIHWTVAARLTSNLFDTSDNTTIFYNPFRKKWVYSVRTYMTLDGVPNQRTRGYRECDDLIAGATWKRNECVHWASTDKKDLPDPWVLAKRPDAATLANQPKTAAGAAFLKKHALTRYGDPTQLYNLDAAPYESLMIGVFSVFYGPENSISEELKRPKCTELQIAYSRDGFHWDRPDRTAFIPATRKTGDWDFNYLHIASTVCTVFADRIVFYYGAWSGDSPKRGSYMYSGGATGIATLRRDGFASMSATSKPGVLTTRPVVFTGQFPFVNVDTQGGTLAVEILDEKGEVMPAFSKGNFTPIRGDTVKQAMTWKGTPGLATLAGKPVRFRFHLDKGDLYAFWVSPVANGASQGCVAAGSPDYPGPADK